MLKVKDENRAKGEDRKRRDQQGNRPMTQKGDAGLDGKLRESEAVRTEQRIT